MPENQGGISPMAKALQGLPPSREQQQSKSILSALGDALGINDAVKALRGEMTEEEAKNFALQSAAGLLIPSGVKAGKLIAETGAAAYKRGLGAVGKSSLAWEHPPNYGAIKDMLHKLPDEAQWQLSAAAREKGFNVAAHHGTVAPEDFSKFQLPNDELGVHFGSPSAAAEFSSFPDVKPSDTIVGGRTFPVALQARNPLRMPDLLGDWGPENVVDHLSYSHPEEFGNLKPDIGIKELRQAILDKGYDSVVYRNEVQNAGHASHILFSESPSDPGYVKGVKAPWAKYEDLNSANLLTGVAGGAVGLGAAPSLADYVKALRGNGS